MKVGKFIFSILMTIIISISAIPLWAGQHYCQEKLVSTSFFSEAASCGMEHGESAHHSHNIQFNKKDCCKDLIQVLENVDHITTINAYSYAEIIKLPAVNFKSILLNFNIYHGEILIPTLLSLPPPLHLRYSFIQVWLI